MGLEMFSLEGKAALVTGASRGIGRSVALVFAEAGADVAVAARTVEDLETLAKEIEGLGRRSLVVPVDVRERASIQAMIDRVVEEFGKVDVIVNNAGGSNFSVPLVAMRPEGWDKIRTLNYDSIFHATQIAAQAMLSSGGGSIINVASVAGIQGAPTMSMYSAAKGGIRLFTQSVAKELATAGIRVNALAPGWIDTPLNDWLTSDEGALSEALKMVPMARMGTPEEIAAAALFLASDASSYVTGTTLVVDGGQTA